MNMTDALLMLSVKLSNLDQQFFILMRSKLYVFQVSVAGTKLLCVVVS